jgi:hypothetical protein
MELEARCLEERACQYEIKLVEHLNAHELSKMCESLT